MFIDGIGISSYRSFGDELQLIGPCGKVNVLIGQNNSGKSNVLRFLTTYYRRLAKAAVSGGSVGLADLDEHLGTRSGAVKVAFGLRLNSELYKKMLQQRRLLKDDPQRVVPLINRLLQFEEMMYGTGLSWFVYVARPGHNFAPHDELIEQIVDHRLVDRPGTSGGLTSREWQILIPAIGSLNYSSFGAREIRNALPSALNGLSPAAVGLPEITLIQAVREIKLDESKQEHDYNGINIVKRLASLERPDAGAEHAKAKRLFRAINQFVVEVIGKELTLEVPASAKTIHVCQGETTLPLEHLGTGIHEVVILAIAATLLENQIVCIEEPEIHLHLVLQRKLIRYLQQETTNQYFITTHSAALIDSPGIAVFHVQHDGECSTVKPIVTAHERFEVAADLGYRASDIVQANCIFWAEGPSDRLYLRHWITSYDPDLIEGIHYSIMFYGGRLLNHLKADDKEVDDFINLLCINRNSVILIDSDRRTARARLPETPLRVRREFDEGAGAGFAWVTAGREIENYIAPGLTTTALRKLYPDADRLVSEDRYEPRYQFVRQGAQKEEAADKMKLAREATSHPADFTVLDLEDRVKQVVRFIHRCNDLLPRD